MIKAIIFDCFGVILADALSVLCSELERTESQAAEDIRALVHAANRGIIDPAESTERVAALLKLSVAEYRDTIRKGEVRDEKLLDYIKTLRKSYKTAMLSNITQQGIERRFPDDELSTYFDEVVISSAIGYAKPDAEAYEITAQRLGVMPAECVFTDDRQPYCSAAEEVGMRAILYTDFVRFREQLTEVLNTL